MNLSCDCPKDRAFWPWPPRDLKGKALHGNTPADRAGVGEKLVFDVVADEDRVHVPVVLGIRKEAPLLRLDVGDDPHIRRHALQGHILHQLFAEMHGDAAAGAYADFAGEREPRAQERELLLGQLRVAPQHFEVLLGIVLHHGDALHAVAVGAHAGDILGDVDVHAVNHGHHRNERGGGQDDAEQGEKAAQFAPAEGLDGADHGFPKRRMRIHL